ncbi:hypothetical protein AB0K60_20560 [Thermopolyspora sp. NPDC052614]|uniref:hypothetical protein n=1 Tax=Thermopolyspora sp. NPDC052614 TaxID=3155682 RepID=UPI0034252483
MSSHDPAGWLSGLPGEPKPLFLWDADSGHGRASCGVTGGPWLARRRMLDAVTAMPEAGAAGQIRAARLDLRGRDPQYVLGPVLFRARRDHTGRLVLDDGGTDSS